MEEDNCDPSQITSVDVNNVVRASIVFINKKRKLQADLLGLPLPKHKCCNRGFTSELGSPSMETSETEGFCAVLVTRKIGEERDSESDLESGNGSDSLAEDADSFLSVSNGAKTDARYLKMCSVDCQSTPVNMGGNGFKGSMFSLDSRVSRSKADKGKSTDMGMECDNPHHDIGSPASLNCENVCEYDDNEEYSCLDYGDESIKQYKHVQELLYSSCGKSGTVLSSENIKTQENQPATEKPTIDKEFEQYFSMLMM